MKHTQGKWYVNGHCVVVDNIELGELIIVADCSDVDVGKTEKQAEADARLIAMAPELLEYIEGVYATIGASCEIEAFAEMRNLIAKAKGEK